MSKETVKFRERSAKLKEILANQPPVTLAEAKAQAKWLREQSGTKREQKKK